MFSIYIFKWQSFFNPSSISQVKHLYTLGAASLHCPSKVGKRIFLLVQSVLTPSEQQPGLSMRLSCFVWYGCASIPCFLSCACVSIKLRKTTKSFLENCCSYLPRLGWGFKLFTLDVSIRVLEKCCKTIWTAFIFFYSIFIQLLLKEMSCLLVSLCLSSNPIPCQQWCEHMLSSH